MIHDNFMGSWYFDSIASLLLDSSHSLAREGFQFCFYHRDYMLFLYRGFNTVYLFLMEVCDSLFWVCLTFPAKVFFFTSSGQRDYNYILTVTYIANIDRFDSKKRHKRDISFLRDLHSTFSYKGAITQDTKVFVITWARWMAVLTRARLLLLLWHLATATSKVTYSWQLVSKQLVTIPDCDIVWHSYNSVFEFVLFCF